MNSSIESLYFLEAFTSFPPFPKYVVSPGFVSIVTIAFFQSDVLPWWYPTLLLFPFTLIVLTFNTFTSNSFSIAFAISTFVAFLFTLKVYFNHSN